MKQIRLVLAAVALCSPLPAAAALSGYWDSAKVIHAILGSGDLADALRQLPIESITRTDAGYEVSGGDCRVQVRVTPSPSEHPGPAEFTFEVGSPSCG